MENEKRKTRALDTHKRVGLQTRDWHYMITDLFDAKSQKHDS
jgi:hypothetical protein